MKVIFVASLYEKETRQFQYLSIIELLEGLGHTVLSSHITQYDIERISQSPKVNDQFHTKIFKALKSADIMVAEVTRQSLGVGYIMAEALKNNMPVLALSSTDTPPLAVFLENQSSLIVHQYQKIRELEEDLPFLLSQLEPKRKKKFNVFLSPEMDEYLLSVATANNTTKSEYLRQLLEKDRAERV